MTGLLYLKRFLRTFGAGESAYTFCEPADEVLRAHHNEDTAGSLEKRLIGRHQPRFLMAATAESRCVHHYYCAPFASRDLVFTTNQGAVAPIRERSLPTPHRCMAIGVSSICFDRRFKPAQACWHFLAETKNGQC
jgi:hypothetical protein